MYFFTGIFIHVSRSATDDAGRAFGRQLGHNVRTERDKAGLTGEQLGGSSRAGVDTIRSIESGRISNPGIYTVARIALALGVSIDSLTPGVDAK
jgi:transcriptional regulator with XRE-family HTH domain